MINEQSVIDTIYNIATTEGGIYSALFGFEGYTKIKDITITLAAQINNETDLYDTTKIFLDLLLSKIILYSNIDLYDNIKDNNEHVISYNGVKYKNTFLDKSYSLDINNICDIELYLNDLKISTIGNYTTFELIVPIYDIYN